jgi:two-component system sensor histidine kinase KdpD
MQSISNLSPTMRWLGATAAALVTTAALAWLHADSTAAGMVFLVLVVWIATQAGLTISLYCAVLCALTFDYFFLPPYYTLRLEGASQWVAVLSFFACSVAAGRVAERARNQAQQAEQRRADVERLYMLSQEMMLHEDALGLMNELPRIIARIFALDAVVLYSHDTDQCFSSTQDLPMSIQASMAEMSLGHSPTMALPGEIAAMPLTVGMQPVGALGWRPASLSREAATAITAQVAIALTRAVAVERSARLEAAREADRLRTALIDSVTHELRTPLTSIRAAATTLREGVGLDDASRAELAAIVDEESAQLDKLIGEAVEMAEIDANVVQIHAAPHHTRSLFEHAVENSHDVLARHHVVINVQEPDDPAWFDAQLLGRVLRHLLENAGRYCPPGSRIVLRSRRAGERLEFSVEDNGPGIDQVDQPLIFEKFYRGKRSEGKGKGTGMGLAITRAIVTAHGGEIEVSSSPALGTTFRFWVPLVEKETARETGNREQGTGNRRS